MRGAEVLAELVSGVESADRTALGRAITIVESTRPDDRALAGELLQSLSPLVGGAHRVGITGTPGVGKSTFIDQLGTMLTGWGHRVAVLAVDPSSPLSGGAILGDRIRMGRHAGDPHVFIRSIAARGHLGGLSANIHDVITLVEAAGFDDVVLETVGAGQSETEVAAVADVKVVISAPGFGDEVQALKAGILEIADVLVVNKADLPGADRTARELAAMLQLRSDGAPDVPLVRTVATTEEGIDELASAIAERLARADRKHPLMRARQRMCAVIVVAATRQAHALLTAALASRVDELAESVINGELDPESAGIEALRSALHGGADDDGRAGASAD